MLVSATSPCWLLRRWWLGFQVQVHQVQNLEVVTISMLTSTPAASSICWMLCALPCSSLSLQWLPYISQSLSRQTFSAAIQASCPMRILQTSSRPLHPHSLRVMIWELSIGRVPLKTASGFLRARSFPLHQLYLIWSPLQRLCSLWCHFFKWNQIRHGSNFVFRQNIDGLCKAKAQHNPWFEGKLWSKPSFTDLLLRRPSKGPSSWPGGACQS